MKPAEFVAKWSRLQQKETALYASHFDDVCRLVGHATPTEHAARHDPEGKTFSFQTSTVKADGQKGFADVFFRDHFIWEYKGVHADLNKAYRQMQLYREALFNPPLRQPGRDRGAGRHPPRPGRGRVARLRLAGDVERRGDPGGVAGVEPGAGGGRVADGMCHRRAYLGCALRGWRNRVSSEKLGFYIIMNGAGHEQPDRNRVSLT